VTPRLSVIVRSYNRLALLPHLLERLLAQDHDDFEIVVVEQSTERAAADVARVETLARDPRVRILRFPPLGGPGARNAGVRAARGQLLVFIDDDDLPATMDWLRRHEANFADPKCLGATGQFVVEGKGQPYANMEAARRNVLTLNVLKWQRVYVRSDRRKGVESLMGGNAAIRRSTLERFGLWDECTPIEDEPSLAYRIAAGKRSDEYLLFDPEAKMIRGLDAPGGLGKRGMSGIPYARRVFAFMHDIIGHYFPVRFVLLYPLYYLYANYTVTEWIITDSKKHDTPARRAVALAVVYVALPVFWIAWLALWFAHRIRHGPPPRRGESH
jgi:glycosyltransferase involved in cell wall biosynthesis